MPRITEELLKKKSEHNDCRLTNLEEISLHQLELEKIECFEILCRHIKILYLQNNIIEKMENLNKLKELEYLNLALNNISMIENIEGCESLYKLDMTVNFVGLDELEESMVNLSMVASIKDLYLTGNPCTDWKQYRDFVIATVPQLQQLDGKAISKSERIQAIQRYDDLLVDLYHTIEMKKIDKQGEQTQIEEEQKQLELEYKDLSVEELEKRKLEEKKPYTKENRREMYMEQARQKEQKENERNPKKEPKQDSSMFKDNGEIRQCNEGKYKFRLREWDDPQYTYFDIEIPKFMDTSFLDVNVNPKWISVRIKGKLTQLKLHDEITLDDHKIQRSQITGILSVTMKKCNFDEFLDSQKRKEEKLYYILNYFKRKQQEEDKKRQEQESIKKLSRDRLLLCEKYETQLQEKQTIKNEDHVTFDDVPDLE